MLTIKDCQEFAKDNGYELSPYAEKIINRTNLNNGFCPCVSAKEREEHPEVDYECPCSLVHKDIKEFGHCHCNLYVAK